MSGVFNRRRKLLVDGSQRQLLGVYFVHFMVILVVFFAALLFIFNQQVIRSGLSIEQKQEFASIMTTFANRMWPTMWVLFLVMIVHALYVSNKIAGPLYRIRSVLTYIGSGNLKARAKLRKGDYLMQDADVVNEMASELEKRVVRMHDDCNAATEAMNALDRSIKDGSIDEARACYAELKSRVGRWEDSLNEFEFARPEPPPAAKNAKNAKKDAPETAKDMAPVA